MSNVNIFQQQASAGTPAESPLHFSMQRSSLPSGGQDTGVIMSERPFLTHLILRGSQEVLKAGVKKVIDVELPGDPCSLNV